MLLIIMFPFELSLLHIEFVFGCQYIYAYATSGLYMDSIDGQPTQQVGLFGSLAWTGGGGLGTTK